MNLSERVLRLLNEDLSSSLEIHDKLNSKIWDSENKINPEVRKHLIKIAKRWAEFSTIPKSNIKDIVLTGGNANYNFTPASDLDVHLVIDRSLLGNAPDLIQDYIMTKKNLWATEHSDLKVKGYPVELYAQDVSETPHDGQGVYSLKNKKWIAKPGKIEVDFNNPHLILKSKHYISRIQHLIETDASNSSFQRLKDRFKNMRATGISKGGEFSFENLLFKILRGGGHLEKLSNFLRDREDRKLSL